MKQIKSFFKDKKNNLKFENGRKSIGIAVATAIVFSSTIGFGVYSEATRAYEVKVGEEVVGIVSKKNSVDVVVEEIEQEKSSEYEKQVEVEEVIVLNEVKAKKEDITQANELKVNIEEKVAVLADSTTISINGNRVAALGTEAEAEEVIAELKQRNLEAYGTENTVDVKIEEKVKTKKEKTELSEIKTVEEAVELIEAGNTETIEHEVEEGEDYGSIAEVYGTSAEKLEEDNPEIDPTHIKVGDKVNVIVTNPYIHIKLIDNFEQDEEIEFETKYDYDDGLYSDNEEIVEEGSNGVLVKDIETVSVNGREIAAEVKEEKIEVEAVNRVIVKGTKERPLGVGTGRFQTPSRGYISSRFGPRWGTIHRGLDIAAPIGTPIVASDSGKVEVASFNNGGYGFMVKVSHGNGYQTLYAHASQLYVKPGDTVAKGDVIAAVGNTGNSTGPHLHFEVIQNGVQVDPEPFLN